MNDTVWVITLERLGPHGDASWMSVHRTEAGAERRLREEAADYGLDLGAIKRGENTGGPTFSKSRLTVED